MLAHSYAHGVICRLGKVVTTLAHLPTDVVGLSAMRALGHSGLVPMGNGYSSNTTLLPSRCLYTGTCALLIKLYTAAAVGA